MRFYDPEAGSISFKIGDREIDIKDIDIHQLRDRIGYVGQEPVLIGSTIR
jgi:ABC-type multidrug transport system fused ATPase/permease subunit